MTTENSQKPKMPAPKMLEVIEGTAEDFFAIGGEVKKEPFDLQSGGKAHRYWIHSLKDIEYQQMDAEIERDENGKVNDDYANAKYVQRCVFNSKGEHVFTLNQVLKLAETRNHIMQPLLRKCFEVNGMGGQAADMIAKNSGPTPTSVSS